MFSHQHLSRLNRITWRTLSDPHNNPLGERGRLQTQRPVRAVAQVSLTSFLKTLIKNNQDLPAASRRCPVAAALSRASRGKTPAPRNNLELCSSQKLAASCKRGTAHTGHWGCHHLCPQQPQPCQARLGHKRRTPGAVTTSAAPQQQENAFVKSVW